MWRGVDGTFLKSNVLIFEFASTNFCFIFNNLYLKKRYRIWYWIKPLATKAIKHLDTVQREPKMKILARWCQPPVGWV